MKDYNDFAVNLSNFEAMAKEYNAQIKSSALKITNQNIDERIISNLFNKIEYLKVVVNNLKKQTSNKDILLVLDDISSQIVKQNDSLSTILSQNATVQSQGQNNFKMFCNNLKIAISTTSDIVKILLSIKDDDNVLVNIKPLLTDSIDTFLDINNSLVSLFGECRYLRYR